ncbi:MAG TPA: NAD(P)-dependent oxidoreductase [Spirochaetia bacterium]|nr:NAD(P)-dependent oxidoreductase [Spirochaetia bacterium]
MAKSSTIGFIGLGTMGSPMARNLMKAGYRLRVYDLDRAAALPFLQLGATLAESSADALHGASTLITMLPDSPHVEQVMLGENGVFHSAATEQTIIDMSTISPKVTRGIAAQFAARGVQYLDAPVSGGEQGARDGRLSIMVGGDEGAFRASREILEVLGKSVTYVGGAGSGQVAKLCNQIVCAMNIQAVCEAYTLGRKMGLDLGVLREVMLAGAASSWMLDVLGKKIIDGDMEAGFRIDLQLKDLRLALEAAFEEGVPLPGGGLVTNLYLDARAHGEGTNGHQALYRVYERLSDAARAQPGT